MRSDMTIGQPIPGKGVSVAYTGTAGVTAEIIATGNAIAVTVTTDAFIEISESVAGTAAVVNTGDFLTAYTKWVYPCPNVCKVSAIQLSSAGTLYVTPYM